VFLVTDISDCRHAATFEYKLVGNQLELHAEPGEGVEGATAKIYWDLDGDGEKDKDPAKPGELLDKRDVTVSGYSGPVTMWVSDPITRKEVKVTKTIDLNVSKGAK